MYMPFKPHVSHEGHGFLPLDTSNSIGHVWLAVNNHENIDSGLVTTTNFKLLLERDRTSALFAMSAY